WFGWSWLTGWQVHGHRQVGVCSSCGCFQPEPKQELPHPLPESRLRDEASDLDALWDCCGDRTSEITVEVCERMSLQMGSAIGIITECRKHENSDRCAVGDLNHDTGHRRIS